jgi:hypothetical protein
MDRNGICNRRATARNRGRPFCIDRAPLRIGWRKGAADREKEGRAGEKAILIP